ncbi:MAG TPA: threonylcarbamoyl-AMP synthase, partial [Saprospiraceae bacterium]|nr:threonylcarbamoyl-AMP synthase [Saprospiraceae bacterium]
MLFADKIIDIINVLENDGVILLPTDTIWSVACSLKSEFGLRKIQSIINIDESPAICVSSIEDLKNYA